MRDLGKRLNELLASIASLHRRTLGSRRRARRSAALPSRICESKRMPAAWLVSGASPAPP